MSFRPIANILWYQSIWFTAVLGGVSLQPVLALMLLSHLAASTDWKTEAKVMLSCASPGIIMDTFLASQGVYLFEPIPAYLPIPLWLAAIWLGFAGTLRNAMQFMVSRPGLMTVAAGCCAPVIYASASRLGAVEFPLGKWDTALLISLQWMLVVPIMIALCRYFSASAGTQANSALATELASK